MPRANGAVPSSGEKTSVVAVALDQIRDDPWTERIQLLALVGAELASILADVGVALLGKVGRRAKALACLRPGSQAAAVRGGLDSGTRAPFPTP